MHFMRQILLPLAIGSTAVTGLQWPVRSYKTAPFTPPVFAITKSGADLAPGLLFITTSGAADPASVIITDDGELVWSSEAGNFFDLNVQTLDNRPILTYWNGTGSPNPLLAGHGYGRVHILDSSYTTIYTICPDLNLVVPTGITNNCTVDIHEANVTPRGTLLVTAYNITETDLTTVGGAANGYVFDGLVFEIDIKTQEILFQWSALDAGIKVSDTKEPIDGSGTYANPFDFFHINSIEAVGDGYLVNSRHLWTTYKLDSKGNIEWRFEGSSGGDFSLQHGVHFGWEHHTRVKEVTPNSITFSMFDNANAGAPFTGVNQTLGRVFTLDLDRKTSTLLSNYYNPKQTLYANSQGSFQSLQNGNVLLGYGQIPIINEYGPEGDVRLSIQFGPLNGGQSSYRAFRLEWHGVPSEPPAIVAQNQTVYVSWNGATGVQNWDIFEGTEASRLTYSQTIRSTSFESQALLSASTRFVQAVPRTVDGAHKASPITQVI